MANGTGLEKYFRQYLPVRDELLLGLEGEAAQESIPIVGPLVGELLFILATVMKAGRILELGTAIGYSTIHLARGLAPGGRVVTLEQNPDLADRARVNLEKAGLSERVRIMEGVALELLGSLDGPFDLAFLDIDKGGYAPALTELGRLLRPGGLLVTDNVAFPDARPFNQALHDDPLFRAVNLYAFLPGHAPERDGLSLAVRVG
jgi:predicted O-methyltransferase YrrM